MLNHALPDSDAKHFSGFDTHPWANVPEAKRGSATAAGAYQILYTKWDELLTGRGKRDVVNLNRKMFSLGANDKKFTPALQDRMAVALIELREALGHVRKGEIEEAVGKLIDEWSSLPGGKENSSRLAADKRPMNLSYFKELFETYLTIEKGKAGLK